MMEIKSSEAQPDFSMEMEQALSILDVLDGNKEKAIEHVEFLLSLSSESEQECWRRVLGCLRSRGDA